MKQNIFYTYLKIALIFCLLNLFACDKIETEPPVGQTTFVEVNTNSAQCFTYYSVLISGNVDTRDDLSVSSRGFVWSQEEFPTIDENDGKKEVGDGIGEFSVLITELLPSTNYSIRAFAVTNCGVAYGKILSFTSLEEYTIHDFDNNLYNTIVIGDQEWMAENLRTSQYNDGTAITTNLNNSQWWQNGNPGAYAIYPYNVVDGINSNEEMINAYGKLYNWYTVENNKGICPVGWKVPSHEDWQQLESFLDSHELGEQKAKALKSCRQVNSPEGASCDTSSHPRWDADEVHFGVDEFLFAGLPAGYRDASGSYSGIGHVGMWWSSTELGDDFAWHRSMFNNDGNINIFAKSKNIGFSVRCIRID